ncbi:hypothetical protein ABT269_25185 [Streptomyces viridosporus]|uniref:hypothetical protein n=1 Tax=Streptomyces viridosporus TaxID=67581 RepID=UPI00331B27AF
MVAGPDGTLRPGITADGGSDRADGDVTSGWMHLTDGPVHGVREPPPSGPAPRTGRLPQLSALPLTVPSPARAGADGP